MKNKTKHSSTYDCLLRDQTSPLCSFAGCRQVAWGAAAFTPAAPRAEQSLPHTSPPRPLGTGGGCWLYVLDEGRPCAEGTLHMVVVFLFGWSVLRCWVVWFCFLIFLNWLQLGLQVKLEWKGRRKNKRSLKLTIKPTTSNISAIHLSSNLSLLPF